MPCDSNRPVVGAVGALVLIVAAATTAVRPARACGPDFPRELLADRGAAIGGLPEGIFVDEAAALVPAHEAYRPRAEPAPPRAPPGWLEAALYQRGAAAFHAGLRPEAARWFQSVLALPPPLRRQLSTSAAYSLARVNLDGGGVAACRQVRALVDAGFVDPDGLAAASLRREAVLTDGAAARALQAQLAALGDVAAAQALLQVVRTAVADGSERELLADPIGQRLVAAYLYARDGELSDGQRARVWRGVAALPHMDGADRLAAAAYRSGDFARAEALAARAPDSAINRWVRAKLAARAGDAGAASALVCSAAAALPTTTACPHFRCGDYLARDRAHAECAALQLAADRPVAAAQAAWAARRTYRDAIYLAERVLTLDELGRFVATLADDAADDAADDRVVTAASMRALYGRRLMRVGRYRQALPWLPLHDRGAAAVYGVDRALAARAPDPIVRAAALFAASQVARTRGMELLGTEHAPDWATWGGEYDVSGYLGHDADDPPVDDAAGARAGVAIAAAPVTVAQATAAERARVLGNAPAHRDRFHYRAVARDLAMAAAELVPRGSAAHDALRCWAEGYGSWAFQDCPEPDFEAARHYRPTVRGRIQPRRHPRWMRRLAARVRQARREVTWPTLAGLLAAAAAIVMARRGVRRPAARP